jgi:AraC-like DNA-binding protein
VVIRPDVFERLCRAGVLLRGVEDAASVAAVARETGISRFHFIRQFEAVFGRTPNRFRVDSRLELARRLLASGRMSVTDVCMEVGFSSLGSFSSLFASRFGEPPSRYRRRARSMVAVPGVLPRELFPGCLSLMGSLPPHAFRNFREAAPLPL